MDYVRREVEERWFLEEAIDPDGIEGLGHVEENCAGEPLFWKRGLFYADFSLFDLPCHWLVGRFGRRG